MRFIFSFVFMFLFLVASSAIASQKIVESKKVEAEVSRVVAVHKVNHKSGVDINLAVVDHGGSTDVSPTQQIFLNLYLKGESFNVAATFDLGPVYSVEALKAVGNGKLEIAATAPVEDYGMPTKVVYAMDVNQVIGEMKAVRCQDFDCDSAKNFKSRIAVQSVYAR